MKCSQCGNDDGVVHEHKWAYQPLLNALICRCGDRVPCDHRLPAALKNSEILSKNGTSPQAGKHT